MANYNAQFYEKYAAVTKRSAEAIAPLLVELVEPGSVIDVGCGTGQWLRILREQGIAEIAGVDGEWVVGNQVIPREAFEPRDLTRPFAVKRTYDLAITFEVGEHLPAASAQGFVESLVRLAPVVAFSAAIPGQGGHHHVNEQWPEYWTRLFRMHDYVVFDAIRPRIWDDERIVEYYRQNMALFVANTHVDDYPALLGMQPGRFDALVHPAVYDYARSHDLKKLVREQAVSALGPLRPIARSLKRRMVRRVE